MHRLAPVHLVVGGRYAPMYWLHLDASAEATLEDLDGYLRKCWLECCGHRSAFRLGERSGSTWATASSRATTMSLKR